MEKGLWSANDFHDVAKHLARIQGHQDTISDIPGSGAISEYYNEKASVRELDGYLKILGGA
ncbi:hypothetical protein ACFSCZ_10770 [Siminovitchia sediminis]|uniref:Uncharacterized protein n=1 Tax=Siminovitchia sediminis TaxID=1274353 RepID=A0ABW4KLX1_9BACI